MTIAIRLASLTFALSTAACMGTAGFSLGGSGGSSAGPAGPAGGPPPASGGAVASGPDSGPAPGAVTPGAPATTFSDFGWEVKDASSYYWRAWIIDKLTTFNVGPTCHEKMLDRDNRVMHAASFYTGDILSLAIKLTGDDWSTIETQSSDREKNKLLIEPMIDAFANRYHMTISIEGDDCDASFDSLWLRYWTTLSTALENNPPESGKAFVNLNVIAKARDITVDYDDATSTYTITAPRDIETRAWDEKLKKPFRKRARSK